MDEKVINKKENESGPSPETRSQEKKKTSILDIPFIMWNQQGTE